MRNHHNWLALMIGNSRLHWALFEGELLLQTFDCEQLTNPTELPFYQSNLPLYIASVVPQKTARWQNYLKSKIITLEDIPLTGIYQTMGIDRALAVYGAGENWGFPCLVIDGGTALTFTGVCGKKNLVGGAILPGLKLQLQSLFLQTAALPHISLSEKLPPRWALDTPGAIESGIIYTILAGIRDFLEHWFSDFPTSKVVFTGGDGELLLSYLKLQDPAIATEIIFDANLIFLGMRSLVIRH